MAFLDTTGLQRLWAHIITKLGDKVDKVSGKGLSTNDYTTEEKNKLAGIADGAEVNVNADWNATSGDAKILNKPTIPSKTSQLTNDSGFITSSDIPEGPAASTTTPKMNGTASVGTETAFARGDHVHPSDTTKAGLASNNTFTGTNKFNGKVTISKVPKADTDAANKRYVDAHKGASVAGNNTFTGINVFQGETLFGKEIFISSESSLFVKIYPPNSTNKYAKIEAYSRADELNNPNIPVDFSGSTIQNISAPATDNDAANKKYVDDGLSNKVDKVTGKGLSTNDFTNADKAKVDAIPSNPKYTDTTYTAGDGINISNTNVISAGITPAGDNNFTGKNTFNGKVVVTTAPTADNDVATKKYVDAHAGGGSGDVTAAGNNRFTGNNTFTGTNTFTGINTFTTNNTFNKRITVNGDGVFNNISSTGNVNFKYATSVSVPEPKNNQDAINMGYADSHYLNKYTIIGENWEFTLQDGTKVYKQVMLLNTD